MFQSRIWLTKLSVFLARKMSLELVQSACIDMRMVLQFETWS